jgi:hypothetical protein
MNPRFNSLLGLSAVALLAISPLSSAQEPVKPPMHMHKSEMDHRPDKEVAVEYKSEATQLQEKSESHRKLAQLYTGRTPAKGSPGDYSSVAKHCENLAKLYAEAAKEADAVSSELGK